MLFGSQFRGRGPGSRVTPRSQRRPAFGGSFAGQQDAEMRQFDFRRGAAAFTDNFRQRQPNQRFRQVRQGSLLQQNGQLFQNPNRGFQTMFRPRDVVLRETHQPRHTTSRISRVPERQQRWTQQQVERTGRINPETIRREFVNRFRSQDQAVGHSHAQGHGQRRIHIPSVNTMHTNTRHSVASNRVPVRVPTPRVEHIGNVAVVRTKAAESQGHIAQTNVAVKRPGVKHHHMFVRPLQRQVIKVPRHPGSHSQVGPFKHIPVTQKAVMAVAGAPAVLQAHAAGVGPIVAQTKKAAATAPINVQTPVVVSEPVAMKTPAVANLPAVAAIPGAPAVAQAPAVGIGSIIAQTTKPASAPVGVQTLVAASEPVAGQTPGLVAVPVAATEPVNLEPTLEEDLQLIQSVIALLQTTGTPSAISGIQQSNAAAHVPQAATNFGINQFGYQFLPGMVGPWAGSFSPAFMQELMFGDTTDPPDPIPTTTVAPNVTAVNATEPAINVTTVTVVAHDPVHEQIPAPQGEGTTLTPEILEASLVIEQAASAEQPPVNSSIPETLTVNAEVKTKITIDSNAGDKVPTLTLEPLADTSPKQKEQVVDTVIGEQTPKAVSSDIASPTVENLNLITIITDALKAASYPAALQEKLLKKLSTVVTQTSLKTESKPINDTSAVEIKVSNETVIKTEPKLSVTDQSNEKLKVSKESVINIESNNAVADSNSIKLKVSNETIINAKSKNTLAGSNTVKLKVSKESVIKTEINNGVESVIRPIDNVVDKVVAEVPVKADAVTQIPIDTSIRTDRLPTAADLGVVIDYNPIVETTKKPAIKMTKNPIEELIKDKVLALVRRITTKKRTQLPEVVVVEPAPVTVITKDNPIKDKPVKDPIKLQKSVNIEVKPEHVITADKVLINDSSLNSINEDITYKTVKSLDKVSAAVDRTNSAMNQELPQAHMQNDTTAKEITYTIPQSARDLVLEVINKADIIKNYLQGLSQAVDAPIDKSTVSDMNAYVDVGTQIIKNDTSAIDKSANEVIQNTSMHLAIVKEPSVEPVFDNTKVDLVEPVNFVESHLVTDAFPITNDSLLNTEITHDVASSDRSPDAIIDVLPQSSKTSEIITKNIDLIDNNLTDTILVHGDSKENNIVAIFDVTSNADMNIETNAGNTYVTDNNASAVPQNKEIPIFIADSLAELAPPPVLQPDEIMIKPTYNIEPVAVKPIAVTNVEVETQIQDVPAIPLVRISKQTIQPVISSEGGTFEPAYNIDSVSIKDTPITVANVKVDDKLAPLMPDEQQNKNDSQTIKGIPVGHITDLTITENVGTMESSNKDLTAKVEAIANAAGKPALEIVLESLAGQSGLGPGIQFLSRTVPAVDPVIINKLTAVPKLSGVNAPDVKRQPIVPKKQDGAGVPMNPEATNNKIINNKVPVAQPDAFVQHTLVDVNMNTNITNKMISENPNLQAKSVPEQAVVGSNGKADVINRNIMNNEPPNNQPILLQFESVVDVNVKAEAKNNVSESLKTDIDITNSNVNGTENKSTILDVSINKSPHIANDSVLNNIDLASLAKELKLISNGTDISSYLSDPLFVSVLEDIVNQTLSGAAGANTEMTSTEIPMYTEMTSTEIPFMTSTEPFMTTTEEAPEIEIEDITTTAVPTTTTATTTVKPTTKAKRKRPLRRKWRRRRVKG